MQRRPKPQGEHVLLLDLFLLVNMRNDGVDNVKERERAVGTGKGSPMFCQNMSLRTGKLLEKSQWRCS